jgi:diguanylate cyclase (GGDEF)-like protein
VHDEDARLIALGRAGRQFAGCSTLGQLLPLAAELALETLQASSASVARLEHDHGLLRVLQNVGQLADWEEPHPIDETYDVADFPLLAATTEAAAPWFADLGEPESGASHHDLLRAMGMRSSISLPVIVGSTIWGEIGAARTHERPSFRPGDVAAGEAFCGLLAAAITRIVERDTLHALAFNDALTGLGNRRAIDDRLERLFAQETLERSVSVILCDVDGLKRINDAFGHDAGDRVLREVAILLTRVAGSHVGSLAVRLGGDEFCLLLEGVSEDEVRRVSDGLIAASRTLPLGAGLSAGWTRTDRRPGDAPTANAAARAVLRLADAAQYRTKRAGRAVGAMPSRPAEGHLTGTHLQLLETVLETLRRSDDDVPGRLRVVATAFAEAMGAAAWSVSCSVDGAAVEIVDNGDAQRSGRSDAHGIRPGIAFEVTDYPATEAALRGGAFQATIERGDDQERAFLAAHGYDEVIAAGTPQDASRAWLVELVGDALTPPLAQALPLLRSLVVLAVEGARAEIMRPASRFDGSSG